MSKTFTLDEVNALELSAADNATILERERIIKIIDAELCECQSKPIEDKQFSSNPKVRDEAQRYAVAHM